jgi:mono/diheme cytochrome c family protein
MESRQRAVGSWQQSWRPDLPTAYWLLATCILISCSREDTKLNQYKVQGEELYLKHCSNCHQPNGKGLGLVYPPLDVSDYVESNLSGVVCLMEKGIEGELMVNGKSFNKPMPALPQLTDLEIAEITTYLYNTWGRNKGIVDVNQVTEILKKCP